jgi:DNA primase
MPSISYAEVRARIPLAEVLNLIGFVPCDRRGDQLRGPCPIHRSSRATSRSFSANLKLHAYKCFKCGSKGNQLDLYASVTKQGLFEAAVALCEQLHHEIPWKCDGKSGPGHRSQMGR